MSGTTRILLGLLGAATIGVGTFVLRSRTSAPPPAPPPPVATASPAPAVMVAETMSIRRGDTLDDLLGRAGLDRAARFEAISAIRPRFDVRKFRAGSEVSLTRQTSGGLESLEYTIEAGRKLRLARRLGSFEAEVVEIPGTTRVVPVCGTMQASLFESIERAGERSELALRIAEIFAWDIDFYTDPRESDRFCFVIEKREYEGGERETYGQILAATYDNAGTVYDAYLFPDASGKPRYYARDGRSLQSAFLRSPMKFEARVSSRFTRRRFHPVLKIFRPHLGTDYAAPTGAPVQSVAAGRVVFSGRRGGAGNMVRIRHAGGYESMYLHLSRRYVRAGQQVKQGQRIGAVGATGLATGPHLDFRLRKNGRYVDFERLKPPRATRVAAAEFASFAAARDRLAAMMREALNTPTMLAGAASSTAEPVD